MLGWSVVVAAAVAAAALVLCGFIAALSSTVEGVVDSKGRARRPHWANMDIGPTALADVESHAGELITSALRLTAGLRA
ncbi:hypothetical protein [Rhodococcus sp. 14-2470-1b]|uniref:hypothetical protein n=1 Tax=Rhodococcus sp. 14-2470-1b TaxID=2023149 RepID=UPI00113FEFDF|nr:hypothetical protein [Rhodococcus sp. 14-2470-1b]